MRISNDPQLVELYERLKLARGGHLAVPISGLEVQIKERLRELTRRRAMEAAAARGDFSLYTSIGTDLTLEDCK